MATITVNTKQEAGKINKHIYGHFAEHLGSCIYGGIWVGEDSSIPNTRGIRNDVVAALKNIKIPNLRWPGGCFADEYHWKDGIGPRENRPSMINTHWGGVVENNHFGTHEFMDLCEQLETEPYICGNVGSGTVQEMQEWVEYITFDGKSPMADLRRKNGRDEPWSMKFFGVGNENWGCGGKMRVEYYADLYRRYQTYVRNYSGNSIYKIACGPSEADAHWTEVMMRECTEILEGNDNAYIKLGKDSDEIQLVNSTWGHYRPQMSGLSLHYYTRNRWKYSSATEFNEDRWFEYLKRTLVMEELIVKHSEVMDRYDPAKRVGLIVDEWGTWYNVEPGTNPGFLYQQNSLRDALVAGINLNIFNSHCDRVQMANIAQTVNVLQAMILTDGEKMVLTPSYHVFEMFKVHQDATLLPTSLNGREYSYGDDSIPALSVSTSRDAEGRIHITLCNLDPNNEEEIVCDLQSDIQFSEVTGRVLTANAINSYNTFDQPDVVKPKALEDVTLQANKVFCMLPPKSVVVIEVQ